MKFVTIMALMLSSGVLFAETCEQFEAKIYGFVKGLKSHEGPQNVYSCEYQIDLVSVQEPNSCGITYDEATEAWLLKSTVGDSACGLTNGQKLSGVLIRKGNVYWLKQ